MSDQMLAEETAQRIFDEEIVPIFFPDQPTSKRPMMTFLVGQPGAAPTRGASQLSDGRAAGVLSAMELRTFHPRYLQLSRSRSSEDARILQDSAAAWMRSALGHARTNKRSLILDGALSSPDVALAATTLFARSGFETSVAVVAVPRPESLLATASKYLLDARDGRATQFTTLGDHDTGLVNTRALIEALESTPITDRLTIIDRDGAVLFDASKPDSDSFAGALAAFDRAQATAPSSARAMRWLSELRAVTDYGLSFRQIPAPLAEVLVELHEIGRRQILPAMSLPHDSQARPYAEAALERHLVAVRQATQVDRRPERRPGPSVSAPEVDRSISI